MGFSALFNAYALRSCLPMAITQMVVPPARTIEVNSIDDTCPDFLDRDSTNNSTVRLLANELFSWSEYTQVIFEFTLSLHQFTLRYLEIYMSLEQSQTVNS